MASKTKSYDVCCCYYPNNRDSNLINKKAIMGLDIQNSFLYQQTEWYARFSFCSVQPFDAIEIRFQERVEERNI